jgi:hypothetical protein
MRPSITGVVIRPDCTYEVKTFSDVTDYSNAVEGFITSVRFYNFDGQDIALGYVDDEGILKKLPLNPLGSAISFLFGNTPYLAGNLVIVGKADEEGYETDIPEYLLSLTQNICDGSKQEA